ALGQATILKDSAAQHDLPFLHPFGDFHDPVHQGVVKARGNPGNRHARAGISHHACDQRSQSPPPRAYASSVRKAPISFSSSMAAWPSKRFRWATPAMEATASKRRPTLVVGTTLIPRSSIGRTFESWVPTSRKSSETWGTPSVVLSWLNGGAPGLADVARPGIPFFSTSNSRLAAERQPSRTAVSPPGRPKGRRCATRSYCFPSTRKNSPPQIEPSSPYPVPSQEMPR